MNPRLIFGLSALTGFVACAVLATVWVWPWLRTVAPYKALSILTVPHVFRFLGLSFLVHGVVSPSLPRAFAAPAAYGDYVTSILAIAAIPLLARKSSLAMPLVWLMNLWGTADLIVAGIHGAQNGLRPQMLGSAFFIVVGYVPLLFVAHVLALRLLWKEAVKRRHHKEVSHAF